MPLYEYECHECRKTVEAHRTVANRHHAPKCCGQPTKKIFSRAHIAPLFAGYRAIGGDRRYITSREEHRDFLREFNYEEVGNDASYAPPPDDPDADAARAAETADSLKQLQHATP